ncbi:hypothetical protein HDU76_003366, partial [Blyttiomyces sp. JEL0837]
MSHNGGLQIRITKPSRSASPSSTDDERDMVIESINVTTTKNVSSQLANVNYIPTPTTATLPNTHTQHHINKKNVGIPPIIIENGNDMNVELDNAVAGGGGGVSHADLEHSMNPLHAITRALSEEMKEWDSLPTPVSPVKGSVGGIGVGGVLHTLGQLGQGQGNHHHHQQHVCVGVGVGGVGSSIGTTSTGTATESWDGSSLIDQVGLDELMEVQVLVSNDADLDDSPRISILEASPHLMDSLTSVSVSALSSLQQQKQQQQQQQHVLEKELHVHETVVTSPTVTTTTNADSSVMVLDNDNENDTVNDHEHSDDQDHDHDLSGSHRRELPHHELQQLKQSIITGLQQTIPSEAYLSPSRRYFPHPYRNSHSRPQSISSSSSSSSPSSQPKPQPQQQQQQPQQPLEKQKQPRKQKSPQKSISTKNMSEDDKISAGIVTLDVYGAFLHAPQKLLYKPPTPPRILYHHVDSDDLNTIMASAAPAAASSAGMRRGNTGGGAGAGKDDENGGGGN